jgi:hypothetical protein
MHLGLRCCSGRQRVPSRSRRRARHDWCTPNNGHGPARRGSLSWARCCTEQLQNPSDLRQSLLRGDKLSLVQDQLAVDFEARIFVDDINVAWRFDIAADRIA